MGVGIGSGGGEGLLGTRDQGLGTRKSLGSWRCAGFGGRGKDETSADQGVADLGELGL